MATHLHTVQVIVLFLLFLVAVFAAIAQRIQIPYPILLTLAGVAIAFVPHVPRIPLQPDLVYPERMLKNLESTGGLVFSGQLLLDLAAAGMSREDAYRLVQGHAMRSWKKGLTFKDEVARDSAITSRLTPDQLAHAFDYTRQLANVDAIFDRVFGGPRGVVKNGEASTSGTVGPD